MTGGSGEGLFVKLSTTPAIPGNATSTLTIETATLAFQSLRVIGDAGPVSQSQFELDWDATTKPAPLSFPTAPVGMYSKLSLTLDGQILNPSFMFTGRVTIGNQSYRYRISDRDPLSVSLSINESVPIDASATVGLTFQFAHALDAVDFTSLPFDDGGLQLDNGNPQMDDFRMQLIDSFVVDPAGSSGTN